MQFSDEEKELILGQIDKPVFRLIGQVADKIGVEAYVVGGFVRDIFLRRVSKDIDILCVGPGIELARSVAKELGRGAKLSVFASFGTAQVKYKGLELEFVGARKESYSRHSRKPIVEDGTLEDDLSRRDFTINALAVSLNEHSFGKPIDLFDGMCDLDEGILRTPHDPDITFSDDPLRMMRAIRFASQLGFFLAFETFEAIERNAERIEIVSAERIIVELNKIMESPKPSIGLELFEKTGLMKILMPELYALKGAVTVDGVGHKDNLAHSYRVLDNLAAKSDDLWLRWAALLHDIGKARSKRFVNGQWTFHNHDFTGAKMLPKIFKRMRLPLDSKLKYVQKIVQLHMRPQVLVDDGVSDSAVRRLLFEAGDDVDDLMLLCQADITSKNPQRVQRYLDNYKLVERKFREIEAKDRIRQFQPPVSGEEIMSTFALSPSPVVGQIKEAIKDAILDGKIPNEYDAAYEFMLEKAVSLGLKPVENPSKD